MSPAGCIAAPSPFVLAAVDTGLDGGVSRGEPFTAQPLRRIFVEGAGGGGGA